MESLVTLKWENQLKNSMRTRIFSRSNSWQKLHHGIHLALNIDSRNRVWSTTGHSLSALTLQQGAIIYQLCHNLCLWCCRCFGWQQLWHSVGQLCHYFILVSSKNSYQEGTRAWPFGSCQNMGDFTQERIEYEPWNHTAWDSHSVASILVRWFRTNDPQFITT